MLNKFKKNNNKGFTLVELLVVIAIIGVLAVVAVPSLFENVNKSKAAKIEADFGTIRTAVLSKVAEGEALKDITLDNTLGIDGIDFTNTTKSPVYTKDASSTDTTFTLNVKTENEKIADKLVKDLGATKLADKVSVTIPVIK